MSGFAAVCRKELLEQVRTFRFLIVLVALVLVGLGSPLLAKVMPELLSRFAGDDTGGVQLLLLKEPGVTDALFQYQKNMALVPLLVIFVNIATLSGERGRGTLPMLLVKPVSRGTVLLAKAVVPLALIVAGTAIAAAGCLLYTTILFGEVDVAGFLLVNALLLLSFTAYLALTLFGSVVTPTVAASAGVGLGGYVLLALLGALPGIGRYTPAGLGSAVVDLTLGRDTPHLAGSVVATALITVALFVAAERIFARQEILMRTSRRAAAGHRPASRERPVRGVIAVFIGVAMGLPCACARPLPEAGAPIARLEVHEEARASLGPVVGAAVVSAAVGVPGGVVERVRVAPASRATMSLRIDGALVSDGDGAVRYDQRRRQGREVDAVVVQRVAPGRFAWRHTKGLAVSRREVRAPGVLVDEARTPMEGVGGSLALWWALAARLPRTGPAETQLDALDVRAGVPVKVWVSRRQAADVDVDGERVHALRFFVSTRASSHTVWIDGSSGALLFLDAVGGVYVRPGFLPPEPPPPPLPDGVTEEDLSIPAGDVVLGATLTRPPASDTPSPGVVLIAGSGPMDRDESPLMVFRDLAHGLAARGFAVLRYDKRGIAASRFVDDEGPHDQTREALARDARAALEALARQQGMDARCLSLVGHSEGGYLAPLVARDDERAAAVVLLAGPVEPLFDLLREQARLILQAHGLSDAELRAGLAAQRATLEPIEARVARADPTLADADPATRWLASYAAYDPLPTLAALHVPVLGLYGGADLQVPASQPDRLRAFAREHKRDDVTVEVIPGVDHTFKDVPAGRTGMGVLLDPDRPLDPRTVAKIGDWLDAHGCRTR